MKLSQAKVVIAMLGKCMVNTNNIFQYDSESCFLGLYHYYLLEYYFLQFNYFFLKNYMELHYNV